MREIDRARVGFQDVIRNRRHHGGLLIGAALAAGCLLVGSAAEADPCASTIISDHVTAAATGPTAAGVVVGIVNGCGKETTQIFGKANIAMNTAPTATTIFQLASVTKTFDATLAAGYMTGAIAHGGAAMSAEDTLNSYLPAANKVSAGDPKSTITFRMLINYISGLARDSSGNEQTSADLFAEFGSIPLAYPPPGSSNHYSNFGYALLGRSIENRLGIQWETQLKDSLITGLGLSDTVFLYNETGSYVMTQAQRNRLATFYTCNGTCTVDPLQAPGSPQILSPAGGLYSTPNDTMRWLKMQLGLDPSVSDSLGRAITATHNGLGAWGVDPESVPAGWYYKSGYGNGGRSFIGFNPEKKLGVYLLANSDTFDVRGVGLETVAALDTSTCMSQAFSEGMLGCPGTVTWDNRDNLCPTGYSACTANQWVAYNGSQVPEHNYWTNDNLKYNGSANACYVLSPGGGSCPVNSPMRVCTPTSSDPEGNTCTWSNCGFAQASPDEYFGGCYNNPTAGTLCCRAESACSSLSPAHQVFEPGLEGCYGSVAWKDRDSLCAPGCSACTAEQWVDRYHSTVPNHHYWTDDDLKYGGTSGACWASLTSGNDCGATPMRVCGQSTTDSDGNTCNWLNCGLDSASPDEYFGGCSNNTKAGTLCCCNE